MALRNVVRQWRRTLVTTLAMAFAGFIMILFSTLMEGILFMTERNVVSMDIGDIQIHGIGYRDDPDIYNRITNTDEILASISKAGYKASYRLYAFALAAAGSSSAGVQLRGVNVAREKTVTEIHQHIMAGMWLNNEDTEGVVLGKKLARILGVDVNDEIVIVGQAADGSMANALYNVRGILKSVGAEIDRSGFFMTESAFRGLMVMPKGVHEIAVMRPVRGNDLLAATTRVKIRANGYETKNWRELRPVIARILDVADSQKIFMLLITYVAVAMVVLNAILMSVFERIPEFGVMKALGVTPWQITLLVYLETLLQIFVASVLAIIFGVAVAQYFEKNGIDLSSIASGVSFSGVAMDPIWYAHITADAIVLPIVFLIIVALVAVIYPAIKASVIQPVKALYHH